MSNVYYDPDKFGLRIAETLEQDNLSYEFDMFVVWVDKDGNLFYAEDSGCSCPSPFESVRSLSDLVPARTFEQLRDAIDSWNADEWWYDNSGRTKTDVSGAKRRLRARFERRSW